MREDYIEKKIYENVVLTKVLIPGEYLQISSDSTALPTYYYFAKDHLGNVRQIQSNSGEILAKNDYYSFGLRQNRADYCILGSNKYKYNGKEQNEFGTFITLDYGARMYDPALGRWGVVDPLVEKYYSISPYAYCANDPGNNIDPDGRFPVWAIVGAVMEYGFQVYDNYKSGDTGYDAWIGNVDIADVGLEVLNPSGKFQVAKTLFVEGAKAVFDISTNEGVEMNGDVKKIVTQTVVNTAVDVGVGKVTNAGSNKAVQNANKDVYATNKGLKTAERQAQQSPNSSQKTKNVDNAKSNAQAARNKQVRTKMLNSTVG